MAGGAAGVRARPFDFRNHPEGNPGPNFKSISDRCHPILVASVRELTKETINLPLGWRKRCVWWRS